MAKLSTMPELEAEVVHPAELSHADVAAWRRLQALEPAFGSPLLGPDFAQAVGVVRADARVAVYRRGDRAIGFLPHHRRPGGFARPIGAPFCDYHALVGEGGPGLDQAKALDMAGLGALRLTGLIDPHQVFAGGVGTRTWAYQIVIKTTAEDYLDHLRRASANFRKNHRRYHRALEKALGPVRIVSPDPDPGAFEQLIGWKRRQIERTGVHDFLSVGWSQALMRGLWGAHEPSFEGLMVSLYAGPRLVAAQFGVRRNGWFHPWIGGFDPDLADCSPGFVHQVEAIAAMPGLGLDTYDLGPGSSHWKRTFAQDGAWVGAGLATASSASGWLARSSERLWNAPIVRRAPLIGRVRSRLEQIAALELTTRDRLRGAVHAVATFRAAPRGRQDIGTRRQPLTERRETWVPS
jgi:CelD/BcsL family acetyltransferase involved in cellulose biosynthesis